MIITEWLIIVKTTIALLECLTVVGNIDLIDTYLLLILHQQEFQKGFPMRKKETCC